MIDPETIDPGEELLGRVGIGHALSRSDKAIRVFKNTPDLAPEIDEAAKRFVEPGNEPLKVPLPAFDYDDVSQALAESRQPNTEAFRYLDSHLTSAYLVAVNRATKYLASVIPRGAVVKTMASSRALPPAHLQVAKFRRIWAVANDVTAVFRALNDGTLTKDQAIAFQSIFPTVFDALETAILEQIADKLGKDRNWTLPYAKDQLLQVVTLTSPTDAAAMKRLQQNFQDAKDAKGDGQQPAKPQGQPSRLSSSEQTPVERAAQ